MFEYMLPADDPRDPANVASELSAQLNGAGADIDPTRERVIRVFAAEEDKPPRFALNTSQTIGQIVRGMGLRPLA